MKIWLRIFWLQLSATITLGKYVALNLSSIGYSITGRKIDSDLCGKFSGCIKILPKKEC